MIHVVAEMMMPRCREVTTRASEREWSGAEEDNRHSYKLLIDIDHLLNYSYTIV
jgi:hypothetical protein